MLRGRRGDGAPVATSRALPSSRSDKSRGGSRGWWFSGWRGAAAASAPPGSSSKHARKAASREALRRRAERRVYKPASFLILFKLACMYVGLTALLYCDFFLAALSCYVNPRARTLDPAGDYLWNCLCCFALLGLPVLLLHLAGYVFLPPVWPEHFPDRDRALEELGGKLYFRFHRRRRGNPNATRRAVEVAVEVLSRTLPSTLWEVEVLTEDDASRLASANVREFVLPPDRVAKAAAWTRGGGDRDDDGAGACELLSYGVERSAAGWGDWVVHMGADAILNQRAVDAVVAHAARESRLVALSPASRPRSRRAAQGAVLPGITRTANAVEGGVPTMFAWIPAMAEVVRAGENVGLTRLAYTRQRVTSPIPNAFLVVPNELERSVGWPTEYTPPGTEMTSFALRCQDKGARFAWLDAGVHAPVTPGAVALFRSRVRDHAGALLLMGEDVALSAEAQIFLGLTCVSAGFAALAPVLTAASPFVVHEPGPEAFAVASIVGACSALARFKYAVGFYVSSGARHLARGAPGYVLYCILFALTLALVPAFSLFEFAAMCAAPFAAPSLRAGSAGAKTRAGTSTSAEDTSDDSLLGSDGEVRRWAAREKAAARRGKSGSNADARARSRSTRRDGTGDASFSLEDDAGAGGAFFDEPSAPATSPPTAARASAAAAAAARKEMMDAERRAWSSRKSRSRSTIGSARSGGPGGDGSEAGGSNVERWFGSPGGRSGASRHSRENDDRR